VDKKAWRGKYRNHKDNATRRGHEFLLTFEEWFEIWEKSGHLHERGLGNGKYCMGRFGDEGPYAVGNVKIISWEENEAELWARPETLERIQNALIGNSYAKGYKHTDEARKSMKGNKNGIGNKSRTGQKFSLAERKKLSEAQTKRWARIRLERAKATSEAENSCEH